MRNAFLGAALTAAVLLSGYAHAADAKLKAGLMEARTTLLAMVKNPKMRDAAQQAKVKASMDDFTKMLAATTPPAGKEAALKELSETTAAYKTTREEELVPALLAGKQAEAEKLAGGVQKQRYEKMLSIIDAM